MGRVVLTQAVTSTIPNYSMQCVALPSKILQGVDRLNRNFMWGSSDGKKKIHLIGWEKITRDKEVGGLGNQAAKSKNTALLAKLNWRFKTEKSALWVRVLSHKYRGQRSRPINLLKTTSCSSTWAGIKKGEDIISKGAKWVVGKDSGLSLWFDKWLTKGTLRSCISGPLNRGEDKVRLRDISSFLGWNWEGISFSFPKEILMEIKATPIPYSMLREDRLSWSSSPSGEFHLKDAYHIANAKESKLALQPFSGVWVWKIPSLPRIKCFLWQCCHQSIPVHALLAKRGMNISPICPMCNAALETISHALKDYSKAQSLWNSFSPPVSASIFYGTQFLDLLRLNCRSMQRCDAADLDWAILFPIVVWLNWNNTIFGKATIHKDLKAKALAKAFEMAYLGIIEKHKQTKTKIQVRWLPPSLDWVKVNFDGSSMGNPGLARGGGLIRNQEGEWVKGYVRVIGCATSVAAELWALRDGIRLCISLKLLVVVFELDAKLVVDLLKKDMEKSNGIDVLVADCIEGLKEISMVRIQHCYRETNKCTDALARRGALMDQDFTIFFIPPPDVVILLNLDLAGTLFDRFVVAYGI